MNLLKSPKCSVCNKQISYKFRISPTVASTPKSEKQFGPERLYCLNHFFAELKKILSPINFGFTFCEPVHPINGLDKFCQSFYYTPEHMPNHGFSQEDVLDTQKLLANIPDRKIFWIDANMTFDTVIPPLFKEKNIAHEVQTQDEFLIRMRNIFAPEHLPKSGEYEINIPYDRAGIYVYYNYL
ncbi:hypothetical protein GF357_00050 [Candidatus Dojkabacteria bacterium]|nr:hypothetical protein [Candidatus Dojkabacteria bacterium]